ncbi:hypothetical protein MMC24_006193 [Lignoscripta atroalba]|nr:hypothetical protein [Lignoscripta atroalba]
MSPSSVCVCAAPAEAGVIVGAVVAAVAAVAAAAGTSGIAATGEAPGPAMEEEAKVSPKGVDISSAETATMSGFATRAVSVGKAAERKRLIRTEVLPRLTPAPMPLLEMPTLRPMPPPAAVEELDVVEGLEVVVVRVVGRDDETDMDVDVEDDLELELELDMEMEEVVDELTVDAVDVLDRVEAESVDDGMEITEVLKLVKDDVNDPATTDEVEDTLLVVDPDSPRDAETEIETSPVDDDVEVVASVVGAEDCESPSDNDAETPSPVAVNVEEIGEVVGVKLPPSPSEAERPSDKLIPEEEVDDDETDMDVDVDVDVELEAAGDVLKTDVMDVLASDVVLVELD